MKREQWDRIGELFDEALARDGARREEFLSTLGEEALEKELRSLLAAHEGRGPLDELADYVTGPDLGPLLHLAPGDSLGSYRIVREIAGGGMATVYEAQDLKHDRRVAVKVLRPELAVFLGADRFLREMRTTARLQHPNILPLFDSGQTGGLLYYVMPYIEGETLREKLNRDKQLSVGEAVRIASEVADALDYAHRHGVVHRDIKPGNILLQEGRPLVADFGIALAVRVAAGERSTGTGFSLGTPYYMSPEQAAAEKDLTYRTDIYSLGCVLYEMLTGESPHTGASTGQVIRRIVTDEPRPVTDLRKSVPVNVAAATAKALEKLPADRFESVAAFSEALTDPSFRTLASRVAPGDTRLQDGWRRLALGLAGITVLATLAAVWGWLRPTVRNVDRPAVEFYLDPPETTSLPFDPVLSPDGRRLVGAVDTDAGTVLYQRILSARDWRIIPGTEGAQWPFFSPDGEWLGFFSASERSIKRVPVEGGSALTVAPLTGVLQGASWGTDDTVVFSMREAAAHERPSLYRVSADGGVPERLTTPDVAHREAAHILPHYLPRGEVVLFTMTDARLAPFVAALSLRSGRVERLTAGMTPQSDRAGRVVYVTTDGTAVAQAFDPRTLTLQGRPRKIAEGVVMRLGIYAPYTLSADGTLAYLSRSAHGQRLLLVSREGVRRPLFPGSGVESSLGGPRFSPAGDRITFVRNDRTDQEVWVYSLATGTARRLSFEGNTADPAWTTDGRSIAYSVVGEGDGLASLHLRAADGTGGAEEILAGDTDLYQVDFAPGDSEIVVYSENSVFRAFLGDDVGPTQLMETGSFVEHPALSTDGRWLAYKSNESGSNEVYVRSYPDMGPPTLVSVGGGRAPAWSADGSEIFYWGPDRMMAASVRYHGSEITVVERAELFEIGSFERGWSRNYDVHPNGQEFVMVSGAEPRIVVRVNALKSEPARRRSQ